jgi:ubiquinone/menaquinone biosynthesis C-methylase UbiE
MTVLYDAFSENSRFTAELTRLEAQAALSWEAEAQRLAALPLPAAPRILELGAGPGFVTERLATLFPRAEITALDCDERLLELARARLEGRPVTYVLADAAQTGLPDNSVDLVVSRYLLQHLEPPQPMLREALRLLRPGGLHVVIEVDDGLWGMAEPSFPALARIYAKAAALQQAAGRDRLAARHLHPLLQETGYTDVTLDAFCYSSDTLGLEPFLPQLDPSRLLPLVVDGKLPLTDLILVRVCLEQFKATPGARVILLGFVAVGRKPS